jgi:hypothetical protein
MIYVLNVMHNKIQLYIDFIMYFLYIHNIPPYSNKNYDTRTFLKWF